MREEKIKHLEFIQNIISRLSQKSFLVKGWSITAISALGAFGIDKMNPFIFLIGIPLSLLFWFLDAKYLSLERCFRILYDKVRKEKVKNFSMKIEDSKNSRMLLKTMFGSTILPIYCTQIMIMLILIFYYLKCYQ